MTAQINHSLFINVHANAKGNLTLSLCLDPVASFLDNRLWRSRYLARIKIGPKIVSHMKLHLKDAEGLGRIRSENDRKLFFDRDALGRYPTVVARQRLRSQGAASESAE